jgi:hypothetical protein
VQWAHAPVKSGLQEGEILALRRQHIDFRKSLIHVSRRWYHNKFDLRKGPDMLT